MLGVGACSKSSDRVKSEHSSKVSAESKRRAWGVYLSPKTRGKVVRVRLESWFAAILLDSSLTVPLPVPS